MRIAFTAAAAVLLALGVARPAAADESKWLTNYEEALKKAKAENKGVLADFTGSDWCMPCQKLHEEVYSKKEFLDWAEKKFVLLLLDFPRKKELPEAEKKQNQELAAKFKIKGYPTAIFLDADGKEKARTSGYAKGGPEAWIKAAEDLIAKGPEKEKPKKVEPKKEEGKAGDSAWLESWDKAVEKAKKEKKLILADFTGSDWCGWCVKLKKEVFDTDDFKKWAAQNAVLLELDYPRGKKQSDEIKDQNKKLAEKYDIQGFPTILVLDADGNKVGELGYEEGGPSVWTKKAQEIIDSKK